MPGDRHAVALVVHAFGWVALLATSLIARAGFTGWFAWLGQALGGLVFVVLAAGSGIHVLRRIRAADDARPRHRSRTIGDAGGVGPAPVPTRLASPVAPPRGPVVRR